MWGVVLDAIDRAVPSLLELTCQWGNSDNEHINKTGDFLSCYERKSRQSGQREWLGCEKMRSLKSVWEDFSRDLYNMGKTQYGIWRRGSRHRKQQVQRPWGWNAVEGEVRKITRSESSCGPDIQGCLGPGESHCTSFFLSSFLPPSFLPLSLSLPLSFFCKGSYQRSAILEERDLVRFSTWGMSCQGSGEQQGDDSGPDEPVAIGQGDAAASETCLWQTQHGWVGATSERVAGVRGTGRGVEFCAHNALFLL